MRPYWCNAGYAASFPQQLALIERGATLEDLIAGALQNGTAGEVLTAEAARIEARERCLKLRAGVELKGINRTQSGRILERRSMKLANETYVVIANDVTALARANEQLDASRQKLEEANTGLQDFSRVAAHDLAGPLRQIRNLHGFIREDMLESHTSLDAETEENFELIDKLLARQSKLISDLLEYSRSTGSSKSRSFDPALRFAGIVALSNLPPDFRVILPESCPQIHIDPTAFDIAMRNLLSNAAKHHDRTDGEVRVTCKTVQDRCFFEVSDDGPGIPPRYLDSIFEPFRTLRPRDHGGGTGLGLSFVKRTVTRWGGTIEALSEAGKRGTVFRFSVPLAAGFRDDDSLVEFRQSA